MYGRFIRAAPTAAFGALAAGILSYVLAPMLALMGPQDGLIYESFVAIDQHALLVVILSILLGLIGGAVTESRGGLY